MIADTESPHWQPADAPTGSNKCPSVDKPPTIRPVLRALPASCPLFSAKEYPPARGTLLSLTEREGVLYTKGIVDFYKTYPGMYIPGPLRIEMFDSDSSLEDIAKEILGLTKMNWNNTQLDGRLPITLECANKVGDIMKYVDASEKPQVSFSFYM